MAEDTVSDTVSSGAQRSGVAPDTKPVHERRDGQIAFHCSAGHRIVVPAELVGKRGTCSKCGVPVQIPFANDPRAIVGSAAGIDIPATSVPNDPQRRPGTSAAHPPPAGVAAGTGTMDWSFIAEPSAAGGQPGEATWGGGQDALDGSGDDHPAARLVARLWAEREHGGVIEVHLAGGTVILPEWFDPRWSRGRFGLFASQAADRSITLTAVAWDTVQRVVVRQLAAVPDDMFA